MQREYGQVRARILQRRLDDLRAATVLEDMRPPLPGRCHELTGNREGELAIDLDHPYRLVFCVADNPVPLKEDGGLDWKSVTAIQITEITDYHD